MKRALALLVIALFSVAAAPRARSVRPAPEDPASWLRLYAAPLTDDDASLRAFLPIVRDARVVGLGDATHGTHEFSDLKRRLIPLLVREAGFRTIAFEAPLGEWELVRHYVATGEGDPAELIRSDDFFFWDADEVLDVIRWARAENVRGVQPPVEVIGIDPAHPHPVADRLLSSLEQVDRALRDDVAARYACLTNHAARPFGYMQLTEAERGSCRESLASVVPLLEARGATPSAIHLARNVVAGERSIASGHRDRDDALAANVLWELARRDARLIIWGHNEHLGKSPYTLYTPSGTRSMGQILDEQLGRGYVAVATTALRGSFWGYEAVSPTTFSLQAATLDPAGEDDYATFFATAQVASMLVPLTGPLPRWLAATHTLRIGGSTTMTVPLRQNVAERFDAIVYVEESTPSRLRHFPMMR